MTEPIPSFEFDQEEYARLQLAGYCGELLNEVVPHMLMRSNEAQTDILFAGAADIDVAFLAYDNLVDDLQSYRIRLVPRGLEWNKPEFKDRGPIQQVIINIPVDFVQDPRTVNNIGLVLVTFFTGPSHPGVAEHYAIAPSFVKRYEHFEDLDFTIDYSADTDDSRIVAIHIPQDEKQDEQTVERQLEDVMDIYNSLKKLIIGNQSLNDGTASN